jgi:hypothetical protein
MDEKIQSLAGWIDILFSSGKHEQYGGAGAVKSNVLEDLARIESWVSEQNGD